MELELAGVLWEWRGPAPYHFVSVPEDVCTVLTDVAAAVTYGWGMIPVTVRIGGTTWATSLWPKDGGYVVPVKDRIRHVERLELGDRIDLTLTVDV